MPSGAGSGGCASDDAMQRGESENERCGGNMVSPAQERRGRDLNPRRASRHVRDFQSRSFGRSDTSPGASSVAARLLERQVAGREVAGGREDEPVSVPELSPELVLVCPDLREGARAALPARPWEALLPHGPPPQRPLPRAPRPSRAERIVGAVPLVVLGAFAAAAVIGSLPWIGERPTLEPPRSVGTGVVSHGAAAAPPASPALERRLAGR